MRKIRNKKWFAKTTALLISALLLVTMLPQAVMAADSDPADQANMPDVTIAEEKNAEEVADDAVGAATVSESIADETAAVKDAATITGAESAASAGSGSGLTSFQIDPIEIAEGSCGYQRSEDMSGEKSYFYYELWGMNSSNLSAKVTVVYDGQEYTGNFSEVNSWIYQKTGKSAGYTVITDQSYDNPWMAGNTYDATVTLMGKSTSVKVKILPSPVTSIQVEPIEIIEGTNGSERSRSGMPSEGDSYFHYELSSSLIKKITLIYNGSEYTGNFNEISYMIFQSTGQAVNLNISFSSNQSYENQWKVGNEYDASVRIMGKQAPVTVKIVPSPVTSIQVEPIEVIEGTNGYITRSWGPDGPREYYYYNPINNMTVGKKQVTVTCNGQEYSGSFSEVASQISSITGVNYSFSLLSDQSYENQWKVGNTYDASVSFMGKTAPAKISIVADPLESIHIDDLTISEGAFQSIRYDSVGIQYLCYTSIPDDTEVTLVYAGKEYKEKYGALSKLMYSLCGEYVSIYFNSGETAENQWRVNHTYPASVSVGSKTCTFNVTVAESPFIGIEAEDIELIEDADGYTDGLGIYRYIYSPIVTMTTKTGEKITGEKISELTNTFVYNGETYYVSSLDDQSINQWKKGPHTATVQVGGLRTNITVNIVETPVERIVFNPSQISIYEEMPDIPEYLLNYTVYFKDGSSVDAAGRAVQYKGKKYVMGLETQEIKAGEKQKVVVNLLGKEATVDVECFAMDSVELVESDGLKLRIKRADGSIDEHKAYCILTEYNRPYWRLVTDKGQFYITCDYTGDFENISISILDKNGTKKQKSNQLKNSKWLKTALYSSDFHFLRYLTPSPILESTTFSGKVTADNIDVIAILVYISEDIPVSALGADLFIDADLMKSKIKERFAVNGDVDMSLSPTFDPSANTIKVRNFGQRKVGLDSLEVFSTDKEQGFWMHSIENGYDAKFVFDDDYKIARINSDEPEPEFIKGDVNGDKAVDAKDLTTLAKHVAKIALITDAGLLEAADVNSDGTVDAKDLTHLAKYVAKIIPEL